MPSETSIHAALREATHLLEQDRVSAPRLTAEVLLGHLLDREKAFLYAHPEEPLKPDQQERLLEFVRQRCAGKPTQYITGRQEFYGFPFEVSPDVFIPRPETELLVEEGLAGLEGNERVLDVGTGSGCVAISIKKKRPSARVIACDVSRPALRVARQNARRLEADVEFVEADLVDAFAAGSFDLVVSNPPYVPLLALAGLQQEIRSEPSQALFAGEDGLEVYGRLTKAAAGILRPGGRLLMELGYTSRSAVEAMLEAGEWGTPTVRTDLAGIDRMLAVRKTRDHTTQGFPGGGAGK